MNDRALRNIVVGLGAKADGVPREDHFVITVASEIMAILCLADDMDDLKKRLSRIIVAYTRDGEPVTAGQLQAVGAMAALLKDAIKPNLVQTLEHNPVIIHGGPFANIAHGCNSVRATKTALGLSDITVTEAGFGADLGAEKFLDIKCRMGVEFYSKRLTAMKKKADESGKPDLNILFIYNMPFRAMAKMTGGAVSMDMVDGIVDLVNGHFFGGLGKIISGYFRNSKLNKQYESRIKK